MTTEQGNKLIGIFHGAEYRDTTHRLYYETDSMEPFAISIHASRVNIEDAKYHLSWDWLMPVIEKIEAIEDNYHGRFAVYIGSNGCTIQATNFRSDKPIPDPPHYFSDWTDETKIKAAWQSVIFFITFYNNRHTSTQQ